MHTLSSHLIKVMEIMHIKGQKVHPSGSPQLLVKIVDALLINLKFFYIKIVLFSHTGPIWWLLDLKG